MSWWSSFRDMWVTPRGPATVAEPRLVDDPDPPGDQRARCPKCGTSTGLTTTKVRYREAGRYPARVISLPIREIWDIPRKLVTEVCERPEHIEVTCRCEFVWREVPPA